MAVVDSGTEVIPEQYLTYLGNVDSGDFDSIDSSFYDYVSWETQKINHPIEKYLIEFYSLWKTE